MVYFSYLFLLVICALSFDFNSTFKKQKKVRSWYLLFFVLITLLVGLRYNIGADTLEYAYEYLSFPKLNSHNIFFESNYQPGWIIIEALFRTISSNFLFLQFFVALFINVIFFQFIWKNSEFPFVTLIVFFVISFFEFETEILRESVAICFGLLMYSQLKKNNYIASVIFLLLAFSIHISAAVLLVLIVLSRIPLKRILFIAFFIVSLVAIWIWESNPELSSYIELISYNNEGKISRYFDLFEVVEWNLIGQLMHYFKFLIFPSVMLYIASRNEQKKYTLVVFGYMFFGVLSHNSNAFLRLTNYFAPFYWLIVADAVRYIYTNYLRKSGSVIILSMLIVILGYFYESRLLFEDNSADFHYVHERYFPYKSVLESNNSYNVTKDW